MTPTTGRAWKARRNAVMAAAYGFRDRDGKRVFSLRILADVFDLTPSRIWDIVSGRDHETERARN